MIEKISKGLSPTKHKEKTILEIVAGETADTKQLHLKSGSWDNPKEPWLIYDENQNLHAMLSIDTLSKMIEHFKKAEQEALFLKLEKSILQQLPLDFQDVLTVAMEELNKSKKSDIDFDVLIKKIKKEHPNLFLDLKDLYLPEGASIISAIER